MIGSKELKQYLELINSARTKKENEITDLLEEIQEYNETNRAFITRIEQRKNTISMLNQQIEGLEEKLTQFRILKKKND